MSVTLRRAVLAAGLALAIGGSGMALNAVQAQPGLSLRQAQGAHARISAARAARVALTRYPGSLDGKIKLENEEGAWQYAVNIRSGKKLREVMVDAKTGKIANVEVTTRAEELKEAQAEAAQKKRVRKGARKVKG